MVSIMNEEKTLEERKYEAWRKGYLANIFDDPIPEDQIVVPHEKGTIEYSEWIRGYYKDGPY